MSKKMTSLISKDNWIRESGSFTCRTCMHYLAKSENIGRCKFNPPVVVQGFVVVLPTDVGCGQHKLRTF